MTVWQRAVDPKLTIVGVQGRIDQLLTPQLDSKLRELLVATDHSLLVDLTETTYINSGGLRCLVAAWRQARNQGGDVVLSGLDAKVQELFEMVGFDKVFTIYEDVDTALTALHNAA